MKSPLYLGCFQTLHAEAVPADGYPMMIEPKHDGFRFMVLADADGNVSCMVRDGETEPYGRTCAHIVEAVRELGLRSAWLDGELVAKGGWGETSSLVRLKAPNEAELARIRERVEFVVFDLVAAGGHAEVTFPRSRLPRRVLEVALERRRQDLEAVAIDFPEGGPLRLVQQVWVRSAEEADRQFRHYLETGHEGAVLKRLGSPYVFDRNDAWVAVKPTATLDGKVVGFMVGEGKHAGRLGSLLLKQDDGTEFGVGTGFSDAERQDVWDRQAHFLGRWAEVKVEVGQTAAVVRNPRFLRWREDRGKRPLELELTQQDPGHKADARSAVLLAEAQQVAASLVDELEAMGCEVEVAGSVRRRRQVVNDVDLVVVPPDGPVRFEELGFAGGPTIYRAAVDGLHVDMLVVRDRAALGAALMHLTGPKERNISQRARALSLGLKLNEKGLWAGEERVAGETEAGVYERLGLSWLEPEAR